MKADNKNIAHKGQKPGKGKGLISLLPCAVAGMMKTGLSGFMFLFLVLTGQLFAQSTQLFSTSGTFTFTVPAGVTSINVQAWGGGGAGGQASTSSDGKGGGGGGAYAASNIAVTAGNTYTVIVGAGGTSGTTSASTPGGQSGFGTAVIALGGANADNNTNSGTGGAGGTASGSTGSVKYAGGNGGDGHSHTNGGGGGGGSSASSAGNGSNGSNAAGSNGGAGGAGINGDGGNGGNNNNSGSNGTAPGGGGGGRGDVGPVSGNGGNGQVLLTWTSAAGFCTGNATTVLSQSNVTNATNAIGSPDGNGAQLFETGDQLDMELTTGDLLTAAGSVNVTWRRVSASNSSIRVEISDNGTSWTFVGDYTNINPQNTWINQSIPLTINTRYIRFTSNNGWDLDIDAISFNTPCGTTCATPSAFNVTGGGNYCSTGPGIPVGLSGSETGVEYQLYIGATPQGSPVSGTGNSLNFGNQVTAGTYTIAATRISGACSATMNGSALVNTLTIPSQPSVISGPASSCTGSSQTFSVTNDPGVTYAWTFPAGWTITSGGTTNSIIATVGASSGNIRVTPSNACGNGASRQLAVTAVTSVLTPDISANYCAGGGFIRLTANGGGAGATYLWSNGETTQQILINIAGLYSVTVTNAAGCQATANYSVATELVVNGDFSAGNTGFTHSTYIYEPDIAGNSELGPEGHYGVGTDPQTYHSNFWGRDHTTGTGNFMIVNGYPGAPQPIVWATTVATVPGTAYYFSAWALSLNSVGNYANLQFRVNNTLVGTTAPLPARPQNNNAPYNWIQFYGTWTAPAGVFSTSIEIVDLQTAAAGNDFGLDDISFATLAPLPAMINPSSNAGNGSGLCPGQTLNLFANLTGGKAPFTYAWTGPAGFTSAIANPSIPNVTAANAGIYKLTITDGYGCPAVTASTSPAKINTVPVCSVSGPATLCPSSTGNTFTAPAGMVNYQWSISGNGTIAGTGGSSVSVNAASACNGSITLSLKMTDVNGCSSDCQQVVATGDLIAPTFTRPADITIHTDANCNYNAAAGITGDVTNEADLCSSGLNATFSDVTTILNPCLTEIKRTWSLVDKCGNAASNQVQTITITDNMPPVLADPPRRSFCVEDIHLATFDDLTTDINPTRPDWYIMVKGSTDLDLDPATYFSDNCTLKTNLILHWRIDFAATIPAPSVPSVSGTGQPSAGSLIKFLGDALDQHDVIHTISYWLEDHCGNSSPAKTADIVIKPRPDIIKQTP